MSNLIKVLLVVACGYGAYMYFGAQKAEADNPLIGQWKSHTTKSMRELQKGGLTSAQEYVLKSILGKALITVTADTYRFELDGDASARGYKITSRNGNCMKLAFDGGDKSYVCLVDGDLHVQTQWQGKFEVFVPIS